MLARKNGIKIPPEVQRFFAAVERGKWDEIEATFSAISGEDSSATSGAAKRSPEVNKLWPAIIDAFGGAEQAHLLPAKALLNYGYEILDSLRPGMVYVGGTDAGRWVPALLNEGDSNQHVVVTQNGLADSSYLEYMRLQFEEQMKVPGEADAKRAFDDYVTDARKRLQHDEQFPNEPKQVRPGEDLKVVDGKFEVSGQIAVMAINEKLLQRLLELNPETSFALQESFPLSGTYPDAVPLGPIMELRSQKTEGESSFTSDLARESLNHWRETAREVLTGEELDSSDTVKTYSHDAVAAANLLAAHDFTAEAEEAYRISSMMWPGNPEAPVALADLLTKAGRPEEGTKIVQEFLQKFPGERAAIERLPGAVDY
jgi:hypothetical protein